MAEALDKLAWTDGQDKLIQIKGRDKPAQAR